MIRHLQLLAFAFAILAVCSPLQGVELPAEISDAVAWYDTLGYPDAKDLPYVRVQTGGWSMAGNGPRKAEFAEGFLVGEEANAFSVFFCGDSRYYSGPRNIVRFIRRNTGPPYQQVGYEVLDFAKASSGALDQARGRSWAHADRSTIFAFARACLQKGLRETAVALIQSTGTLLGDHGEPVSWTLRETLQRQMGAAVLQRAEEDLGNPRNSWAELLKVYESFEKRFPASPKGAIAREAAETLRMMIAEEAAHHPKPLEQMSPQEQAAESIYQLRYVAANYWFHQR
jgi:hypothetical protein